MISVVYTKGDDELLDLTLSKILNGGHDIGKVSARKAFKLEARWYVSLSQKLEVGVRDDKKLSVGPKMYFPGSLVLASVMIETRDHW